MTYSEVPKMQISARFVNNCHYSVKQTTYFTQDAALQNTGVLQYKFDVQGVQGVQLHFWLLEKTSFAPHYVTFFWAWERYNIVNFYLNVFFLIFDLNLLQYIALQCWYLIKVAEESWSSVGRMNFDSPIFRSQKISTVAKKTFYLNFTWDYFQF